MDTKLRWLASGWILTFLAIAPAHAGSGNRWLLDSGIVFPSLNGSLSLNAGKLPFMGATAVQFDHLLSGVAGTGDLSTVSLARGGGSWGAGVGVDSLGLLGDGSGVTSNTLFAGFGGRVGGVGLGVMTSMPVSPVSGSADFSFGLLVPGGSLSYALVVPSSLGSMKGGLGFSSGPNLSFEANLDFPMELQGSVLSGGVQARAGILGLAFTAASTVTGSGLSGASLAAELSLNVSSNLALLASLPGGGLYSLGLNWAL
jgi:hypothetical protein